MKFIAIGIHHGPVGWTAQAHSHPFCELVLIFHGMQRTVIGGGATHFTGPGDMLLFTPGTIHQESTTQPPHESMWMVFEWPECPCEIPIASHDVTGRIRQLMTWLHMERDNTGVHADRLRNAYLEAIVAEHLAAAEHEPVHELVHTTKAFVRENIGKDISLQDLARLAGMSRFHFLRTYKKLAGRTPMADVRELRLEYARELILTTDLPLKAVAIQCGLKHASFLCHHFRKAYDMTPGEMRRHLTEE